MSSSKQQLSIPREILLGTLVSQDPPRFGWTLSRIKIMTAFRCGQCGEIKVNNLVASQGGDNWNEDDICCTACYKKIIGTWRNGKYVKKADRGEEIATGM